MASSVLVLLFIIIVAIAILFLVQRGGGAAVGAAGAMAVGAGGPSYNYHAGSYGGFGGGDPSAADAANATDAANAAIAAANNAIDIMYAAPKAAKSGDDKSEAKKLDDQLNDEVSKVLNSARVVIGTYTNDVNSLPTAITSISDFTTMHQVLSKAASANKNNQYIANVLASADVFKQLDDELS
jgi:hypothetical protein